MSTSTTAEELPRFEPLKFGDLANETSTEIPRFGKEQSFVELPRVDDSMRLKVYRRIKKTARLVREIVDAVYGDDFEQLKVKLPELAKEVLPPEHVEFVFDPELTAVIRTLCAEKPMFFFGGKGETMSAAVLDRARLIALYWDSPFFDLEDFANWLKSIAMPEDNDAEFWLRREFEAEQQRQEQLTRDAENAALKELLIRQQLASVATANSSPLPNYGYGVAEDGVREVYRVPQKSDAVEWEEITNAEINARFHCGNTERNRRIKSGEIVIHPDDIGTKKQKKRLRMNPR